MDTKEEIKSKKTNSDEIGLEISPNDIKFMQRALELAKEARDMGEVPVGAVVVRDGKEISSAFNRRQTGKNALFHAEVLAIDSACRALGGWRLPRCTLYVTMEPCPMCAGAIVNSRIERVVYGTPDLRAGALGGVFDLRQYPLNHQPTVTAGVCRHECLSLLQDFFKELRKTQFEQKKKVKEAQEAQEIETKTETKTETETETEK